MGVNTADAYLNEVLVHVRWKRAHGIIRRELADHISDAQRSFLEKGIAEDEAERLAVLEMGDAAEIGARFDAAYRPPKNYGVWIPFAAVVLMGFFLRSYAAGCVELSVFTLLAPAAFFGMCFLRFDRLVKLAWPIYGVYLLAAVLVHFMPALRFAVYMPILFPVLYALLIYRTRGRGLSGILLLGAAFAAQMLALLNAIPFNLAVLALVCLFELFYAVLSGWFSCKKRLAMLVILIPTAIFCLFAVGTFFYSFERRFITIFPNLNPYLDNYCDGLVSEILGKALWLGATTDTYTFSERVRTSLFERSDGFFANDYLLVWLSARLGRIVLVVVGGLFAAFFAFLFRACAKQQSTLYRLTSLGITLHLFTQFMGYFLANLGLSAFFTYPLPFVSDGNAAMLCNAALMGLLFSMLRSGALMDDEPAKKYPRWRLKLVKEEM